MKMPRRRLALFGILDRYVAKLFLSAYLVALMMIVGLYLVVDLASNLDDYLRPNDQGTSPGILAVARYYTLHVPFLYLSVAPFVTLMAALFTVAKLQKAREVIAALSAGMSVRRLLLPLFVSAALIAVFMAGLREVATESIGFERDALRYSLDKHLAEVEIETMRVKDVQGEMIQLGSFRPGIGVDPRGVEPSVFHDLDAIRFIDGNWFHFVAERGRWIGDHRVGHWELEGGYQERVSDEDRIRTPLVQLDGQLEFSPRDVWSAWKGRGNALELSLREARSLSRRDPDNVQYQTLMNYLVTFPLANLVLLLVGLPFLMQFERGRGTEGLVAGFLLCVVYFAADFVTLNLGLQGHLDPLLASALPPLFFGSLGLVLFGSIRT
ncbi:LptF/LptG family permease [Engelhardtia mirabilis]|uniref:Putative permease YjgP/YjgQ family protein n=1 Tax=Engelhardtia mirabilis TaxID=2528011 RepID=A0A518BIU2_9BACT|nr:putative permease YjgP/YjgQ family protein [Planctomycetes bacterium Pla133]QDV01227.1 putative permease YjgP/YjgQ family protein [Planctomycetes bacterium Pla86]